MRHIEEIAAEERAKDWEVARGRLRTFLVLAGSGLSLWGWTLFRQGRMGLGALAICGSLLVLGSGWGIWKIFRFSPGVFLWGLLASIPPLGLYWATRTPSFYWGKDPSFWLSVQAGALGEPAWSPLSYLLGQALCFLLPRRQFLILPELSGIVLSAGLFWVMVGFCAQLKNKSTIHRLAGLGVCWLLAASLPFWSAATLASGLLFSLGFLLFVIQKILLAQEERPWDALYFLLGLLAAVHPLWGILGLLVHGGSLDGAGRRFGRFVFAFLMGWTPFLWIGMRAGLYFPSWGGAHPFAEWLRNWRTQMPLQGDWDAAKLFSCLGWLTLLLSAFVLLLWALNYFKWKGGTRSNHPAFHFWTWIVSGAGGILFFSASTETLGPVILAFLLGLGEWWVRLLERGLEKRHGTFFSGARLAWTAGGVLALAAGLVFLPGQHVFRNQVYFPQQHALNLLQAAAGRSVLVCDDPFEAAACREARLMEPISLGAVILEKRYLNQKWYVSQCSASAPQLLFAGLFETTDDSLKSLVLENRDDWEIHWARSALPEDWKGPKAFPTVLTQLFEGKSFSADYPESVQYRFDLTALPGRKEEGDGQSAYYFSRYLTGFNELGKKLMDQGLYMASIHAFNRALILDPSYPEPQSRLAQMYSQQKILEAAQLEFEKTIKNHPQGISLLMSGLEQAQRAKDEVKSVTLLDQMIRLNTELAEAQYQLSIIYNRQGKNQESKALLESSVRLNPKQIEAQLTLGHLMAGMGNRIKAEEAFRAVLGVDQENKEAQVQLWKLLNQ